MWVDLNSKDGEVFSIVMMIPVYAFWGGIAKITLSVLYFPEVL
jgi:hypothetical protein